jgi:transposase
MQLHLDEIARHVAKGAHAVVLLDRAGWHITSNLTFPPNITPILLPSRAPELNPVENVWQYLRSNWLSNRVFDTYGAVIDAACEAWMRLIGHARNYHLNRHARMGRCRSRAMTVGIS